MDAGVVGEFGMEGGGQDAALTDEDGAAVTPGEDFDLAGDAGDARGADEDHLQRAAGQGGLRGEDGGIILAAVGVPLHGDIQCSERGLGRVGDLAGQEDAAGAGAKDRLVLDEVLEHVIEAGALKVLEEGGGFAAGDDEGVEFR